MQSSIEGEFAGVAKSIVLPIIDLKSTDESCICSTLLFIQKQARLLNIETPCVTFDQPLWLKATAMCHQLKLDIVCRLGGFHMFMSFLGGIGVLMIGSGLAEALESCCGSHTISNMMTGKLLARALRGHLLVAEALMRILLEILQPECFVVEFGTDDNNIIASIHQEFESHADSSSKSTLSNEDSQKLLNMGEVLMGDPTSILCCIGSPKPLLEPKTDQGIT